MPRFAFPPVLRSVFAGAPLVVFTFPFGFWLTFTDKLFAKGTVLEDWLRILIMLVVLLVLKFGLPWEKEVRVEEAWSTSVWFCCCSSTRLEEDELGVERPDVSGAGLLGVVSLRKLCSWGRMLVVCDRCW